MTNTIKIKHLEACILRLNEITKNPIAPWININGKMTGNIGCYHLDAAYGGYKLVRMDNESGGIRTISQNGYTSKRDLHNQLLSILSVLGY